MAKTKEFGLSWTFLSGELKNLVFQCGFVSEEVTFDKQAI
jgi:hypothetical protein